jgi:hypothetical protein
MTFKLSNLSGSMVVGFPPRQKPGSFSVDRVREKLKRPHSFSRLTEAASAHETNYWPNMPDRFNNQKTTAEIPMIRPIDKMNP